MYKKSLPLFCRLAIVDQCGCAADVVIRISRLESRGGLEDVVVRRGDHIALAHAIPFHCWFFMQMTET